MIFKIISLTLKIFIDAIILIFVTIPYRKRTKQKHEELQLQNIMQQQELRELEKQIKELKNE